MRKAALFFSMAVLATSAATYSRLQFAASAVPAPVVLDWLSAQGFREQGRIVLFEEAAYQASLMSLADGRCPLYVIELDKPEVLLSWMSTRTRARVWDSRRFWLGGLLEGRATPLELQLRRAWYRVSRGAPPPMPALLLAEDPACLG